MRPKPGPKSKKSPLKGYIPDSAWRVTPAHLSDRAKSEYERVVGILADMGRLGVSDGQLVALYAMNVDMALTAYETLLAEGLTVTSDRGNVSKHPLLEALNAATVRVKAISTALGITPSSTEAAKVEPPSGDDAGEVKWDGILKFADA